MHGTSVYDKCRPFSSTRSAFWQSIQPMFDIQNLICISKVNMSIQLGSPKQHGVTVSEKFNILQMNILGAVWLDTKENQLIWLVNNSNCHQSNWVFYWFKLLTIISLKGWYFNDFNNFWIKFFWISLGSLNWRKLHVALRNVTSNGILWYVLYYVNFLLFIKC